MRSLSDDDSHNRQLPSLAIAFANTTGYSVILLMGMEPFSGQAYGTLLWKLPDCSMGWSAPLAILTSVSVCLECWWYEIMVVLCELLAEPKEATVARQFSYWPHQQPAEHHYDFIPPPL
ncbi:DETOXIFICATION 49 protein [Nymphaea thermarum]|nr:DETOXIFICATION 49 protein [Nymphaea thermarum]